ncbi:velvet factor-domain-containing protein [Trametes punicea]|nr:velvet factor-domain-containing protein [Trametes punicea]
MSTSVPLIPVVDDDDDAHARQHYPRPQPVAHDIGFPVTFTSGLFAERTIRVQLQEIQKADLGRKYARKDKRPLDPPPVVLCHFFEVIDRGDGRPFEVEVDPEEVALGALCHVDLFPVPSEYEPATLSRPSSHRSAVMLPPIQAAPSLLEAGAFPSSLPRQAAPSTSQTLPSPYAGYASHTAMLSLPPRMAMGLGSLSLFPPPLLPGSQVPDGSQLQTPALRYTDPSADTLDSDIVAWYGNFPVRESSRCTIMLSGATFMQAAVVGYKGKKATVFVFSDLAVKVEGTFVLRYRVFNMFSARMNPPCVPVLAECYGGPFKVYSTKEFPGLKASTDLTKHLALYGVRVNLRESPRKRRKKSELVKGGDDGRGGRDHRDDHDYDHADDVDMVQSGTGVATRPSPPSPASLNSPTTSIGSWSLASGPTALYSEPLSGASSHGSRVTFKKHFKSSPHYGDDDEDDEDDDDGSRMGN